MSDFIARLDKAGLNEEGGFKTFLDISPLSRERFKIGPRDLGGLITGFSDNYVFTDVLIEPFSSEAMGFAYLAAVETKKRLNFKAASPGFEDYVFSYALIDPKLTRSPDRWITADSTGALAAGDVAFGLGRALERPVWASSLSPNLLYFRAVQYCPLGFLLLRGQETPEARREIQEIARLERPKSKKPIANLVLGPGKKPKFNLPRALSPIVNALNANGYEIRVSFDSLIKKADLYYVIGREEWLENLPFFDELLRLADARRSRFYGPLIFHPFGEIQNRSRWKSLRKHFHIPDTEEGWVNEIPFILKERGVKIAWGGGDPPQGAGMTALRADAVRHAGGEVFISELVANQTLAVILKAGNHYLVNGSPLDFEAGYILAQMFGKGLGAPTRAYVSAGRFQTAALALEDTRVSVRIPTPEPPQQWRKTVYDPEGKRSEDVLIPGSGSITADLLAGELLILSAP